VYVGCSRLSVYGVDSRQTWSRVARHAWYFYSRRKARHKGALPPRVKHAVAIRLKIEPHQRALPCSLPRDVLAGEDGTSTAAQMLLSHQSAPTAAHETQNFLPQPTYRSHPPCARRERWTAVVSCSFNPSTGDYRHWKIGTRGLCGFFPDHSDLRLSVLLAGIYCPRDVLEPSVFLKFLGVDAQKSWW